jgi:hypothetical protein
MEESINTYVYTLKIYATVKNIFKGNYITTYTINFGEAGFFLVNYTCITNNAITNVEKKLYY